MEKEHEQNSKPTGAPCPEQSILLSVEFSAGPGSPECLCGQQKPKDGVRLTFLEKYGEKYEVIDAEELGINAIDESVNEYFCPMLFYAMSVAYRTGLQDKRRHPLDMRRYMGVVEY